MKKIFKLSMMSLVALFALFALVGCAGVSQSFADEINEKAEAKENYTYEQLKEKLGDPTIDVSGSLGGLLDVSGVVTWAKGYENLEAMNEALEEGKTVKTLVVTFFNGRATAAEYKEVVNE